MHAANVIDRRAFQRRIGLSLLAEQRLREALRLQTPSEPWIDAQFKDVAECDERATPVVRRYHDEKVFPPGGAKTLMIPCKTCGIPTPPHAMEDGNCLDHREAQAGWGPSPSAMAIAKFECYTCIDLEPESTEALEGEIRQFHERERDLIRKQQAMERRLAIKELRKRKRKEKYLRDKSLRAGRPIPQPAE